MNYEAERLILAGMLELACEQQVVLGIEPSLTDALEVVAAFPVFPDSDHLPLALTHLSRAMTPEAFERTYPGTSRAIRTQHERLVNAILR